MWCQLIGDSGFIASNVPKVLKQAKHDLETKDATEEILDPFFQVRESE